MGVKHDRGATLLYGDRNRDVSAGGTVFVVKVMAEIRDYDLLYANGVCP